MKKFMKSEYHQILQLPKFKNLGIEHQQRFKSQKEKQVDILPS